MQYLSGDARHGITNFANTWQDERDWRNNRPEFTIASISFVSLLCLLSGAVGIWAGVMPENLIAEGAIQCYVLPCQLAAPAGAALIAVSLVGLWSAQRTPKILLVSLKWALLGAAALECWSGALCLSNTARVDAGSLRVHLQEDVRAAYGKDPRVTYAVDYMQRRLSCCGFSGPEDWKHSRWAATSTKAVPESCCRQPSAPCCNCLPGNDSRIVFHEGCADLEISLVSDYTKQATRTTFILSVFHINLFLCVAYLESRF